MKPLEELADDYIAEVKRLTERIEKLKIDKKAAKAKGNEGEEWEIKSMIAHYEKLRIEAATTAYKLKNYYREKQDRKDLKYD